MQESGWIVIVAVAVTVAAVVWHRSRRGSAQSPASAAAAPKNIKPVHVTRHARERMLERGVSQQNVELVIERPDRSAACPDQGSVRLERKIGARVVKVWVAAPWPAKHEVVVKSVALGNHQIRFAIPAESVGLVLGKSGRTVAGIRSATGAQIHVRRDGSVVICADDRAAAVNAQKQIKALAGRSTAHQRRPANKTPKGHRRQRSRSQLAPPVPLPVAEPRPSRDDESIARMRDNIDKLLDKLADRSMTSMENRDIHAKIDYYWQQINQLQRRS